MAMNNASAIYVAILVTVAMIGIVLIFSPSPPNLFGSKLPPHPANATAVIQGTVKEGPTKPVCAAYESCTALVMGQEVTATSLNDPTKAFKTTTNNAGYYALALPPGAYRVTTPALPPSNTAYYSDVSVADGKQVTVNFELDTHLR